VLIRGSSSELPEVDRPHRVGLSTSTMELYCTRTGILTVSEHFVRVLYSIEKVFIKFQTRKMKGNVER